MKLLRSVVRPLPMLKRCRHSLRFYLDSNKQDRLRQVLNNFFLNVGPPKEDFFSGHLLSPIFHINSYKFTSYNSYWASEGSLNLTYTSVFQLFKHFIIDDLKQWPKKQCLNSIAKFVGSMTTLPGVTWYGGQDILLL